MAKPKAAIGLALVAIVAFSFWMGFASSPLYGIAVFFVLTCLLWAVARIRRWI